MALKVMLIVECWIMWSNDQNVHFIVFSYAYKIKSHNEHMMSFFQMCISHHNNIQ